MPDRGFADREPEFGRQLLGDLVKRDVGFLLNQIQNEGFMGIQLRTWRLTFLARRRLAMLHIAPIPFPRRRYANAKAPRRLTRRKTFRNHLEDPQTKVPVETMRYLHLLN